MGIRYRWGSHPPQPSPFLPRDHYLTVYVGDIEAWRGDVAADLARWARWCALLILPRPDVDPRVGAYLRSADPDLRDAALASLGTETTTSGHLSAATMALGTAVRLRSSDPAVHRRAALVAGWVGMAWVDRARDRRAAEHQIALRQEEALRTSLLRNVLPMDRWPLIEGHPGILGDALLEGTGRITK